MNDLSKNNRVPLQLHETRTYKSGSDERPANCRTFIRQRTDEYKLGGVASTLACRDYKSATDLVVEKVYDARGNGDGNITATLTGDHQNRVTDYTNILIKKRKRRYIVRRLTPLECCRLQGFPDYWTDDTGGSDSARYKMWGNGIALPCAVDVLWRIANHQ